MTVETITNHREVAVLSSSDTDDGPYKVHGVALGVDDVTKGKSNIKKRWTEEALEDAAETLAGKPIVKNHKNDDIDAVVGGVTDAKYVEGKGVVYDGEIDDEDYATKIDRGRYEVSPRVKHQNVDEMSIDDDGSLVVDSVDEFINLSLTTNGAAPSNFIGLGEPGNMAAAELQETFDYDSSSFSELTSVGEDVEEVEEDLEEAVEDVEEVEDEVDELGLHSFDIVAFEDELSDSEVESVVSSVSDVEGVMAMGSARNSRIGVIVDSDEVSSELNDAIVEATDDTSFEVLSGFDWVDRVQFSSLSESTEEEEETVSKVSELEVTDLTDSNMKDEAFEELQAKVEAADADVEELTLVNEAELSDLREDKEELQSEVEALQEDVETIKQKYAESLADATSLDAEFFEDKTLEDLQDQHANLVEEGEAEEVVETPAPRSGEATEEELTSAANAGKEEQEEEDGSVLDELSADEVEELGKIRNRIANYKQADDDWGPAIEGEKEDFEDLTGVAYDEFDQFDEL